MSIKVDAEAHYNKKLFPIEFPELDEIPVNIKNIGWTLGNDCPYRCKHCYSMSARKKGMNFTKEIVDRVVNELFKNGIETVNLGGNEPLFTNGLDAKKTLLPYIIDSLTDKGIEVGLTTSGVTLLHLEKHHNTSFLKLNDVDVSLDSPFEDEHNANREAKIYHQAIQALELCQKYEIDHSVIMCGMNWNFTLNHLVELVRIAQRTGSNIRINPIKPVESAHMDTALSPMAYYEGFSFLMKNCDIIDLGEPPLATVSKFSKAKGCPCGITSFRIHSITPDGKIPVSPCVYLHDFKVGNLVEDDLIDVIHSEQFRSFRRRNKNPEKMDGCNTCDVVQYCRGGCAARSYLHHMHETGERSLFVKDPYCPVEHNPPFEFPQNPQLVEDIQLVHMDYLCTWIGKPKANLSL